jgi:outer membrane protein OmpA-like peptidoglycan-associated protein
MALLGPLGLALLLVSLAIFAALLIGAEGKRRPQPIMAYAPGSLEARLQEDIRRRQARCTSRMQLLSGTLFVLSLFLLIVPHFPVPATPNTVALPPPGPIMPPALPGGGSPPPLPTGGTTTPFPPSVFAIGTLWPLYGVGGVLLVVGVILLIFGAGRFARALGAAALAAGITAHGTIIGKINFNIEDLVKIEKAQLLGELNTELRAEIKKEVKKQIHEEPTPIRPMGNLRPIKPASPVSPISPTYLVHFDWNSDKLSAETTATLATVAARFAQEKFQGIEIFGYTDLSGRASYNQQLSERRDDAVKKFLLARGIPSDAIITNPRGQNDPRVPTRPGVRELENRRVEIVLKGHG